MIFSPPLITKIEDVLPAIKDCPEFIVIDKKDYSCIDYVYVLATSFQDPNEEGISEEEKLHRSIRRECRGLKFDKDGNLISRPYHKFKNLGEDKEYSTTRVDLSLPHVRLDKLDGSMVHSCSVDGGWRLMTRKGESEVAKSAWWWVNGHNSEITGYHHDMWKAAPHLTFIYEYVGPNNKIVIDYEKEELILTGVRNTRTGWYMPYWQVCTLARKYGIPYVGTYQAGREATSVVKLESGSLVDIVSTDTDKEGCIIRFASGAMVKMKSDIYVRKHRSKDLVCKFKDLVSLIVNDQLDDVLPQLDEETKAKVVEYRDNLRGEISMLEGFISGLVKAGSTKDQKTFALWISSVTRNKKSLLFNTRKTGDGFAEISRCIQRACSDTQRLTELFEELRLPIWTGDFFTSET